MTFQVETRSLCKEYPEKKVLTNVSFGVEEGEIFTLIGPNGAGKTTLLRILDLLDEPSSGTVWFQEAQVDYSARDRLAIRRRIGIVFQRTTLFNTSVFQNVAYGLKIRRESAENIGKKVKAALRLVSLEGFESKSALSLSGGEAQRVSLAQVLVTEPELLLLDEPTANLDPRSVSIVEEVLSRVNRDLETTIIMATHNMFQAETLADRVGFMLEGRIEKIGKIQDIFALPSLALTKFARLENVFSGTSRITDVDCSMVDIGDGVQIEATTSRLGNVSLHVRPEDIILSSQPIVSSARNSFEGRITEISDLGSVVKLKISAGKDFTVQITKRSFNEMQLNLDRAVFLTFKASSVQVF